MAKISLAIYLMLLVALSTVYETLGTFSLPLYLKNFPKEGKDVESFAYKGLSEFMVDLEGKCPRTTEFKELFVRLKDYLNILNSPVSKDIQVELTKTADKLYSAMSAFPGTSVETLEDAWMLVESLLSLEQSFYFMKKRTKEITLAQREKVIESIVKWTRGFGIFVKKASENKGQSIDLSSFGIESSSPKKRGLYESKGTFSLPHYLQDFPKMSKDFEPFAYEGMLDFMSGLESKCPPTAEFKDLFAKVEDYMTCFKSGSKDMDAEMSKTSVRLFKAMSLLDGTKGGGISVDSWRLVDGMLSMGKVLVETGKNGSEEITFDKRKELIGAMVKWARALGLFVKTVSEGKGKSIDLSPFGIDYSGQVPSPSKGTSSEL